MLFLTKEVDLHPELAARFEAAGSGAFRVVLPAAAHDGFTDTVRFRPRVTPLPTAADRVLVTARQVLRGFLDHAVLGAPQSALAELAPATDTYLDAYPLAGRPPLPSRGPTRPSVGRRSLRRWPPRPSAASPTTSPPTSAASAPTVPRPPGRLRGTGGGGGVPHPVAGQPQVTRARTRRQLREGRCALGQATSDPV